ncbi:MAG TPA: iron chelate uptake ABC transporter family permease subunit, partial [Bacillales bacterium]|nr:iron chelate uptake ABC transporter family permease subunit [Bacillales bacterium]
MASVFLILSVILGISIGTVPVPMHALFAVFATRLFHSSLGTPVDPATISIVFDIRLPRVLLAALVGASLSIAGAGFQGLLKNPLADPYTLGVSSGASVGAVLVLFYGISLPLLGSFTLPFVSVLFALITILLVLLFSRLVNRGLAVETIILTGVIFSSFLGSLISLMS